VQLSVIIVNRNTKYLLKDCLDSIKDFDYSPDYEFWVVDNNSNDGSVEMLKHQYPWVNLIESRYNRGFAYANNLAIKQARGRYIMLLNPDTRLLNNAFNTFIEFLDENPNVGICGGLLFDEKGQPTYSYGLHFPSLWWWISSELFLGKVLPDSFFPKVSIKPDIKIKNPNKVAYVTGADFVIRRKVIDKIGLLDDNFFAYFEETDWSERAAQAGWESWYLPGARIMHLGGQSFNRNVNSDFREFRLRIYTNSKILYFKKRHHSWKIRLALTISYIAKLVPLYYYRFAKNTINVRRLIIYREILKDNRESIRC
jgi:GT2 family glycosyltransferase